MTRHYLRADAPAYAPATLRGAWDDTASMLTKAGGAKNGATVSNVALVENSATDYYDEAGLRIVIPLTEAGTVSIASLCIGAKQISAASHGSLHIHAFVTEGASDTVRGVVLEDYIHTAELPVGSVNVGVGITLAEICTPLAGCQVDDLLVVEFGVQSHNTSTDYLTVGMSYGGTNATDLTDGGASGTFGYPGWIDVSVTTGGPVELVGIATGQGSATGTVEGLVGHVYLPDSAQVIHGYNGPPDPSAFVDLISPFTVNEDGSLTWRSQWAAPDYYMAGNTIFAFDHSRGFRFELRVSTLLSGGATVDGDWVYLYFSEMAYYRFKVGPDSITTDASRNGSFVFGDIVAAGASGRMDIAFEFVHATNAVKMYAKPQESSEWTLSLDTSLPSAAVNHPAPIIGYWNFQCPVEQNPDHIWDFTLHSWHAVNGSLATISAEGARSGTQAAPWVRTLNMHPYGPADSPGHYVVNDGFSQGEVWLPFVDCELIDHVYVGPYSGAITCRWYDENDEPLGSEYASNGAVDAPASGVARLRVRCTGTGAWVSFISQVLVPIPYVGGHVQGEGGATGTLSIGHALTGALSGAGSLVGNIPVAVALAGHMAGEATTEETLSIAHALAGIEQATAEAEGTLSIGHALESEESGEGEAAGTLTVTDSGEAVALEGTEQGDGGAEGTLTIGHALVGESSGEGSAIADARAEVYTQPLTGDATITYAPDGSMTISFIPDGTTTVSN